MLVTHYSNVSSALLYQKLCTCIYNSFPLKRKVDHWKNEYNRGLYTYPETRAPFYSFIQTYSSPHFVRAFLSLGEIIHEGQNVLRTRPGISNFYLPIG